MDQKRKEGKERIGTYNTYTVYVGQVISLPRIRPVQTASIECVHILYDVGSVIRGKGTVTWAYELHEG